MIELEPKIWKSNLKNEFGQHVYVFHYEYKNGIPVEDIQNSIKELYNDFKNKKDDIYFSVNILVNDYQGEPAKWRRLVPFRDVQKEELNLPDLYQKLVDYYGNYEIREIDKLKAFQVLIIPKEELLIGGCYANNEKKHNKNNNEKKLIISFNEGGKKINKAKGVSLKERHPIIFKTCHENIKFIECFDGDKYFKLSIDDYKKYRSKPLSSPYIFIISKTNNLKLDYEKFVEVADKLKEISKGKYNLYKTGEISKAALNRFYEINKYVEAETVTPHEFLWISRTNLGGLMWAKKDYMGEGYEYDINSAYPSIYMRQNFLIPIKVGDFRTITKKEFEKMKSSYFKYGIYKCKVIDADQRLFSINYNNFYTHFDLTRAKELGYKMELIDESPNFLSYEGPGKKINGCHLFRQYVKEIIRMKNEHPELKDTLKKLLNSIWGVLCEKKKSKIIINENDDLEYVFNMNEVHSCLPFDKNADSYILKKYVLDDPYETPFARLGTFLVSKCRQELSRLIEPYIDSIVRIHTDGFISSKELPLDNKLGDNIGELKKKYCNFIHVKNVNLIVDKNGVKAVFK
ncbi:MAG: hypothetical protein QW350_04720 [Candidatus Aenigmatarchaeota archaeon]